jgi:hypothetical protein
MKKRIMFFAALVCGMTTASFAATVTNVIVRQQWPWSYKVNVDYRLLAPEGGVHDVKLTIKNGEEEIGPEYGSVSKDQFAVGPGDHCLVWDPKFGGANGNVDVYPNLTATVSVDDDDDKLYMIVDVSAGGSAATFPVTFTNNVPAGGWNAHVYKQTKIVFRRIPAGTFVMGFTPEEISHYNITTTYSNDFFQRRKVTLTKPYYIAIFPTTRYQQVNMGEMADPKWRYSYPLSTGVTYNDLRGAAANLPPVANSILGRLNAKTASAIAEVLPGYRFDLPTYAQWQCACRAGTATCFNNGKDWAPDATDTSDSNLDEVAWYGLPMSDASNANHDYGLGVANGVGNKAPNAYGLYDMQGLVVEFIRDMMSQQRGASNGVTNPQTDPLLMSDVLPGVWGCGGRTLSPVVECLSNYAKLVSIETTSNSKFSQCIGYRLALVAD